MNIAIEAHDVTVAYASCPAPAISGISFTLPRGTVMGLLGPNGAGKTSLVHALTTVIPMTSGDALILGRSARAEAASVRRLVGLMSQVETVDWGLSVGQQIEFEARLVGLSRHERAERVPMLMERFGLTAIRNSDPSRVSGGQLKRMQLVRTLLARPPILFLDEPTLGLDPLGVDAVLAEIRALAADGTTVVLATNEMEQAAAACDQVLFIRGGTVVAQGAPSALAAAHGGSLGQAFRALAQERGELHA